jgi:hypothetical protein
MGKKNKRLSGNSHQRSIARAKDHQSPLPPVPVNPEKTKTMLELAFSWPVISVVAGLIIASGLGVLSMSPPETKIATVLFSIGFPLLLTKLCAWIAFERSEPPPQKAVFIGLLCAASGVLWFACVALANSKVAHIEESKLKFDCLATNIGYQENTEVAGVKWNKAMAEVRLSIRSVRQLPMLNVDVTYQATAEGQDFMGMEHIDSISGVEFHRPPLPEFDSGLRLIGKDGSIGNPMPQMNELMAKAIPWSHSYRVTCPRLEAGENISIKAVMTNDKSPGLAPSSLKIDGSYETPVTEGASRRVTFTQLCEVKKT